MNYLKWNLSNISLDEMNYCDIDSLNQIQASVSEEEILLYKLLCPLLIFGCLLSVVLNLGLFFVGRISIKHRPPVLILSLNLATTDTIASFLNGLSFFFNSYLPVVFNVRFHICPFLAMELARSSALMSSVLHLLALAFFHYFGIVKPLHYRTRAFLLHPVSRSTHLVTLVCWLVPLIAFTTYFASIPCQGFRSKDCDYHFLTSRMYRFFILLFFMIPLLLMLTLYIKIFFIIKKNEAQVVCSSKKKSVSSISSTQLSSKANSNSNNSSFKSLNIFSKKSLKSNSKPSFLDLTNQSNPVINQNCETVSDHIDVCSNRSLKLTQWSTKQSFVSGNKIRRSSLSSRTKALNTTLLILGTFLICYVPGLCFLVLTCTNGCPFALDKIDGPILILISFFCNALVIVKTLVDPLIYTFRVREVKLAIMKIFYKSHRKLARKHRSLFSSNQQ